ncbi:hypothetical protein GF325_02085 [Candidatus Bathyarchaeota archaeon]|nr:hypothetical protein [Candidatus Bathyarchaeota archaeon]
MHDSRKEYPRSLDATALLDSRVLVDTRSERTTGHPRLFNVAIAPDGKTVAAGGEGGIIHVIDVTSGDSSLISSPRGNIESLHFSKSENLLYTCSDHGVIAIRSLLDHSMVRSKELPSSRGIYCSILDAVAGILYTGSLNGMIHALNASTLVSMWEWETYQCRGVLSLYQPRSGEECLLAGRVDGVVLKLMAKDHGNGLRDTGVKVHEGPVFSLTPVQSTGKIITAGMDGCICLLDTREMLIESRIDTRQGKVLDVISVSRNHPVAGAIAGEMVGTSSPPHRLPLILAAGGDGTIAGYILDGHGNFIHAGFWWNAHEKTVEKFALDDKHGRLYTVSSDGRMKMWRMARSPSSEP